MADIHASAWCQEERHSVGLISICAPYLEKFELFPDPPAEKCFSDASVYSYACITSLL
jgi:hypothetical protein